MAMGQSKPVGGFVIANVASTDIRAKCLALGDQGIVLNLGDINMSSGSKWGSHVDDPTTSISCTVSLAGKKDALLSMWEKKFSPLYDLPVRCNACHWAVDETGFFIVNPRDGQFVHVVDWKSK
ncbi:unnamed protein product [Calypogeia fissa]